MDAIEFLQIFEHEGLEYRVMISSSGGFGFELTGGNSPKGSTFSSRKDEYNLFPECSILDDVDLVSNALPVYRKAGEILIDWFYTKRPWRVHFSASTDRKVKIYRWFANRLKQKLPDEYQIVEYPEGHFEFYRVKETPS